jgi:hypothetical protein
MPRSWVFQPARSISLEWVHISHDITKFIFFHQQVIDIDEIGNSIEDILCDALDLFQQKVKKVLSFLHCWPICKSNSRLLCMSHEPWNSLGIPKRKAPTSCVTAVAVADLACGDGEGAIDLRHP